MTSSIAQAVASGATVSSAATRALGNPGGGADSTKRLPSDDPRVRTYADG